MNIHIVEDDFGVRDALLELARGLGHSAAGYADAEAFMHSGPPAPEDVVIVDLGLPGIEGADVIRWLLGLAEPPRIVAISGRTRSEIDSAVRGLADLTVLRKPLAFDAISRYL